MTYCRALVAHMFSAALALPVLAQAQGAADHYPSKPVRIIVPLAAGGPSDTMARILAKKLTEIFGQTVIVDNRPGASAIIGTELGAKAPADGYTIVLVSNTIALNPAMFKKLPYDTDRDLQPVSLLAATPYALNVHPSLPVRSLKDLIALAKSHPGELNHASAGNGTGPHLAMEVFMQRTGTKMVHIIYKGGGPAMIDFLAGQTQVYMANLVTAIPQIRANKIRPLAVSSIKRSAAAPELPTLDESGLKGFDEAGQHGVVAPSGILKDTLAKLHAAIVSAMRAPEVANHLANEGSAVVANSPDEYRALIRRETAKWQKIVEAAGIKPQ